MENVELGRVEDVSRVLRYDQGLADFLRVMDAGEVAEIDSEMFDYWLEVLPPTGANREQNGESMRMAGMGGQWTRKDGTVQRFSFAFAEGLEPMTVFWQKGERYFAQRTNIINPRG